MIKVNGVDIPTPSDLTVSIMDISKAERNARGTMIIERIATKRRLELSWNHLSKDQLSGVLNRVSSTFFTVEYIDPQTNNKRTGTFYVGDRNTPVLDYKQGVIRYKDVQMNFIER